MTLDCKVRPEGSAPHYSTPNIFTAYPENRLSLRLPTICGVLGSLLLDGMGATDKLHMLGLPHCRG